MKCNFKKKDIIDFGNVKSYEQAIKNTWDEFRDDLSKGKYGYKEIEKAKKSDFLKGYDDLFCEHEGFSYQKIFLGEIKSKKFGRGTVLRTDEDPDYDRFIPKKEFIKEDNRFSPPGVEWLYLALGDEDDIHQCSKAECRAKKDDRFGFCHFKISDKYDNCQLIDLTISDSISYYYLNRNFEKHAQTIIKMAKENLRKKGCYMNRNVGENTKKELIKWATFTFSKLLSEQIFIPLDSSKSKKSEYAPFQTIAQYYISLGYSGIIYGSTVSPVGKNIVLFDKNMAYPTGDIEITSIS